MLDKRENTYKIIVTLIALLCSIGVLMVYSSSYIYSKEHLGSQNYLFFKHVAYLFLGLGVGFVASRISFYFYLKNIEIIFGGVCLLLLMTLNPVTGAHIKGAYRWIHLAGFSFQPSELYKVMIILFALKFFHEMKTESTKKKIGYALFGLVPSVLFLYQPDFGSFLIGVVIILYTAFMGDYPIKRLIISLGVGLASFVILILSAPYRVQRVLSYLDPWANPRGSGFQIIQSYLAFANGSFLGKGIGNSDEKLFYLPEAYNDFIFSVVGEELGFVGVVSIVLLFLAFIYMGFKISSLMKMSLTRLFIVIGVFSIGFQTFLNMGVVLGLLPTKGLNLPFISYGGSSLIANFLLLGLMTSAIRYDNEASM